MILLTKLNQQKILVNLETIKYIEAVPDTLIFFTNGESIMVREDMDTVSQAIIAYQSKIFQNSQFGQVQESLT